MNPQHPSPGGSSRPRVIAAAGTLGALLVAVLTALLAIAGPASAAGPSLSTAQATGLNPAGQTITVNGSGFSANKGLFLAVCNPAIPNGGGCDNADANLKVTTSASGAFSASLKVVAVFGTTDCTKVSCVLETNDPSDPTATTNVATLAISFASAAAAPAPTQTTSPALPKGTDAGQADTNGSLIEAVVLLGVAVLLLGSGGVLYSRRRAQRS